jgi:3-hydroxybutyryl-CoA dehydrogenase
MKLGLLGFGKMGRNIFALASERPIQITVVDLDGEEMERTAKRWEKRLRREASGGTVPEAELVARREAVRFTTAWDELRGCDLVIETVFEDLETKREVLRRAEQIVPAEAVITSNTSGLSIARLAEALTDRTRFCGYHFFHPVQLTTIVEIITAATTSPATVEFLRTFSREIGRTPLVVRDLGGSCINVPLTCHSCEALYVLEQGLATPSRIDAIAGGFARFGPCEGMDVVGTAFFARLLGQMLAAFPVDYTVPELLGRLEGAGRRGKYATQGLYLYRDDRPVDSSAEDYVTPTQVHSRTGARGDDAGLRERLLYALYYPMLKLAQLRLASLADVCLGISDLIGLKIDPLAEMRALGSAGVRTVFERLQHEVGPRFDPSPLADALAELD